MRYRHRIKRRLTLLLLIGSFSIGFLAILLPGLLMNRSPGEDAMPRIGGTTQRLAEQSPVLVPVFLSGEQRVEEIPLELYVRGVLAAEMPANFELEALKAQAIAARTYIVRRIQENGSAAVSASGGLVTDTVAHQAYLSEAQLRRRWGLFEYSRNMEKLSRAVMETAGQIITYNGQPIDAVFFSTSNGFTENSEEYWGQYVPYLRSVESPWDRQLSPRFQAAATFAYADFVAKLGLGGTAPPQADALTVRILERTEGNRVKSVQIAGRTFTGREVREKLGLQSSEFAISVQGGQVSVTTSGYGHGVGMSQWGANGMAREGRIAADIIHYYYQNVSIERIDLNRMPL